MAVTAGRSRKYHVALSFAGEDRAYVQEVADALKTRGVTVFYDRYEEANLWGKNLYDHLRSVYAEEASFTVLFISQAYATKVWTNHERQSAQARALEEQSEYVLPARFDETHVPGLLKTIGYIDLRRKHPLELAELVVQKLTLAGLLEANAVRPREDRLVELRSHALLDAAFIELQGHGLSIALSGAILGASLVKEDLADFLKIAAETTRELPRYSVAVLALECIDKRGVGYEAVEFCLADDNMSQEERNWLGMRMQYLETEVALGWAHDMLTTVIRNDACYQSFLTRHSPLVFERWHHRMAAYLLVPDRGPTSLNADSMFLAAKSSSNAQPYVRRLHEWIRDGDFDGRSNREGAENTRILYFCLNEALDEDRQGRFAILVETAARRIRTLLKRRETFHIGLQHIWSVIDTRFIAASAVARELTDFELEDLSKHEQNTFRLLRSAVHTLVEVVDKKKDSGIAVQFAEYIAELREMDNVSGYWGLSTDGRSLPPHREL